MHSGPYCTTEDVGRLGYLYPTQYDVGVDNNFYCPVSWLTIKQIIQKQIEENKPKVQGNEDGNGLLTNAYSSSES